MESGEVCAFVILGIFVIAAFRRAVDLEDEYMPRHMNNFMVENKRSQEEKRLGV